MQHRSTFTINEENYIFLKSIAGANLSAYINLLIEEKKNALLSEAILKANLEEAQDEYKNSMSSWDNTVGDGID